MRPLITAGPIARASRPPKVSESIFTSSARAGAASRAPTASRPSGPLPASRRIGSVLLGRLGLGRHLEARVVQRRVQVDLVDRDVLLLGLSLGAVLDRVRDQQAAHVLVVADRALHFDLAAAHRTLRLL